MRHVRHLTSVGVEHHGGIGEPATLPRLDRGAAAPDRRGAKARSENERARELFKRELFGSDEPLSRVVDYFKAAAAGSDVGRRLLLMLGPPSGGKSTLAILIQRGLEVSIRTDEGELEFFSTIATFGTAVDITVSELAIESFFPADERTGEAVRRYVAAAS